MARSIVLRLDGEESAFAFSKVERDKLYGRKQRVVVDENGRTCGAAWLTADGTALVPNGGTAHVWIDDAWNAHEQDQRTAVDREGQAMELRPSTLGVPQIAQVVSATRVLDLITTAVYQLAPETLSPKLEAALSEGAFVELPFRFRAGHDEDHIAVLLKNEEGYFALVSRKTGFAMLEREAIPLAIEPGAPDEELDGDLDFSMF